MSQWGGIAFSLRWPGNKMATPTGTMIKQCTCLNDRASSPHCVHQDTLHPHLSHCS